MKKANLELWISFKQRKEVTGKQKTIQQGMCKGARMGIKKKKHADVGRVLQSAWNNLRSTTEEEY